MVHNETKTLQFYLSDAATSLLLPVITESQVFAFGQVSLYKDHDWLLQMLILKHACMALGIVI